MRKMTLFAAVFAVLGLMCFAQGAEPIDEPPFLPMNPEVMAQGGSFVASAHGYNSLFYNPAGFARPGGSFTLASATTWMYARPDRVALALEGLVEVADDTEAIFGLVDVVSEQITTGGFGAGAAGTVFGIVGGGFGLGATFVIDSYIYGRTIFGAEGDFSGTFGLIAGYAVPFEIFGIKFSVGGDVRPMMRVRAPITNANVSTILSIATGGTTSGEDTGTAILNSINAVYGWGLGFDLGAIMEIAPFSVGIAVKDLFGTSFEYKTSSLKQLVDSELDFEQGTAVTEQYVIPMNIYAGVAWHPDMGFLRYVFDPILHLGLEDPIGVFKYERSPWTLLHVGGEVKLLSMFSVRGGLNQGYLTVGGGAKLLFMDVNFALFTRELGKHIGDRPNSGVSVEAALRF